MGFGYLVVGYFFATNFVYESLTALPAALLMLPGIRRLALYNRPLRGALYLLYFLLVVSLAAFLAEAGRMANLLSSTTFSALHTLLTPALAFAYLLFTATLLSGIAELAQETELEKQYLRARRNRALTVLAYGLCILLSLPFDTDGYAKICAAASLPVLLFRFAVTILNLLLFFSCYMYICLPQDVDMERKKTGIAFVDRMEDKLEEKEKKAQVKKREELAELYRRREKKYREKQARKGKK